MQASRASLTELLTEYELVRRKRQPATHELFVAAAARLEALFDRGTTELTWLSPSIDECAVATPTCCCAHRAPSLPAAAFSACCCCAVRQWPVATTCR
jgi:hypothetical protein